MLLIDGKRIIPAPTVNLNKSYVLRADGQYLGTNFSLALDGMLLPNKGSPNSAGTFHTASDYPADEVITDTDDKFNSLLRKQDALRALFQPGSLLEYGPNDGSPAVTARVKTANIAFAAGTWVDKVPYSITLETETLLRTGSPQEDNFLQFQEYYLSSASEAISVQTSTEGDGRISISHTITATGRSIYENPGVLIGDVEPWENAKTWCLTKINDTLITSLVDTTSKTKYNKVSSESIDTMAGSYSITITYTVTEDDAAYIHTYEISKITSRSQINDLNDGQNLEEQITINGQITGLSASNINSERLAAAYAAFESLESTIPTLCDLSPAHLFINKTVGKSLSSGSVAYSYTYSNYPGTQKYTNVYTVNDSANSGGISQISINGTIKAFTIEGDTSTAFTTAQTAWTTFKSSLRSIAQGIAGTDAVSQPVSISTTYSAGSAEIGYAAVFNYSDDINTVAATYLDMYDVTVNEVNTASTAEIGLKANSTATISGSIVGYDVTGQSSARYANAMSRWNTVKLALKDRVQEVIGGTVVNRINSKSISINKLTGTVTYSCSFVINNNITSENIISEDIQVETSSPIDVVIEQMVPGLAAGPIYQNLGTRTSSRRTVTINIVTTGDSSSATTRADEIKAIYEPEGTSYITNDTNSFNPYNGSYSRSISWIYRE